MMHARWLLCRALGIVKGPQLAAEGQHPGQLRVGAISLKAAQSRRFLIKHCIPISICAFAQRLGIACCRTWAPALPEKGNFQSPACIGHSNVENTAYRRKLHSSDQQPGHDYPMLGGSVKSSEAQPMHTISYRAGSSDTYGQDACECIWPV